TRESAILLEPVPRPRRPAKSSARSWLLSSLEPTLLANSLARSCSDRRLSDISQSSKKWVSGDPSRSNLQSHPWRASPGLRASRRFAQPSVQLGAETIEACPRSASCSSQRFRSGSRLDFFLGWRGHVHKNLRRWDQTENIAELLESFGRVAFVLVECFVDP